MEEPGSCKNLTDVLSSMLTTSYILCNYKYGVKNCPSCTLTLSSFRDFTYLSPRLKRNILQSSWEVCYVVSRCIKCREIEAIR